MPAQRCCYLALPVLLTLVVATVGCNRGTTPPETREVQATPPTAPGNSPRAKQKSKSKSDPTPPATTKQQDGVKEIWEASYIGAAKVGHTHTTVETVREDGEELVRTVSEQRLQLSRSGDVADQQLRLESVEKPNGDVVRMTSQIDSGDAAIRTQAKVSKGKLQITQSAGGSTNQMEQPWQRDTGGYFALNQSLERDPIEPGENRKLELFVPAVNQVAQVELTAAEAREVEPLLDGKKDLLKVDVVLNVSGAKLKQTIWTDQQGSVLKSYDPQVQLLTYRTTQKVAEASSSAVFKFDSAVFIPATGVPLENPHQRKRAVYRVTLLDENPVNVFPSSATQRVKGVDEKTAEIEVVQVSSPGPTQEQTSPEDLAGSTLIQVDDPRIQGLAFSVAKKERDPMKIAMALEEFVHDKVERKDYTRAFDSAADVARKLQGDCTEHSVLLAALCRARDIPSRVASGLVAYRDGFAYHMWTEAWTGAQWTPLDATLGRGGIGVGHIKLVDSNLSGANSFAALLPVLRVINRLQIRVVEVE